MKTYEVNEETIAVIGISEKETKVVEKKREYLVEDSAYEVMDYSCQYFGSSYLGRVNGSKKMLGYTYKLPIIVEESKEMIFFPISSPEILQCIWVALKWYSDVLERKNKTYILLKNGKKIECTASKNSIQNQVMRASRLNLILNERKTEKKG